MTIADSLRDVRYFVAVYEERSFTGAAERENATQSGVSQRIRKLEERAGLPLFLRGGAQIVATPAGKDYYGYCVELLRINAAADVAMQSFDHGLTGEVAIGLMPTMTRCVLAPALLWFADLHPNVIVRIVEGYSSSLIQQVRESEVAFAIVPDSPASEGLSKRPFVRTPELLVSASSREGHGTPIQLAALPALKVVTPSAQHTRRQTLLAYCSANHVGIRATLELDTMFATLDLIRRSDWVAILPGIMMASDLIDPQFSISPLCAPPLWLELVVVQQPWHASSAAAVAFLSILESETRGANAIWADRVT
jgi:LysR family nitrogen assimilation transcriptional regulator